MSHYTPMPQAPRRIPPHILRRRRIVAVVILLIILGLIGWGIWALVGLFTGDDSEQPDPTPTTDTATAEPTPSQTAPDDENDAEDTSADACPADFLNVSGATDQESYAAGEMPVFTMTITHDGDVLCDASLGSDQQNFVVQTADEEFVFATRACQVQAQEQVVEMEPGQSEEASFEWERVGTDEACETIVEDLAAGDYQLIVSLGDRTAQPVDFTLE